MRKGLQLELGGASAPQLGDLLQARLSREDDTPRPESRIGVSRGRTHDARLRRHMHGHARRMCPHQRERTQVRHDDGVDAHLVGKREKRRQVIDVRIGHDRVKRNMHGHAARMRKRDRLRQLLLREVLAARPHTPTSCRQIHGIGSKMDGRMQLLGSSRR